MSKKFKYGQRICCIENTIYSNELSVGGIYVVLDFIETVSNEVYISNDEGYNNFYPREYFIDLKKNRNEVIDYIMSDES